jgi:hypothetical protein
MVHTLTSTGPTYDGVRPFESAEGLSAQTGLFPVYDGLVDHLVKQDAAPGQPDEITAHVLAVLATYAYSDLDTVLEMATRLGLPECRGLAVEFRNDPEFIVSTAHLLQSRDGRLGILVYRGTMPVDLVNWLTDVDASPEKVRLGGPDEGPFLVHAGFYRNVRATRFKVAEALGKALGGEPIHTSGDETPPDLEKLQALYVTGHSLGGAMAALMGILVHADDDYARRIEPVFKGVYTYGQPMVGSPELARHYAADDRVGGRTFRYIYEGDPVPRLPSRDTGSWGHFGAELHFTEGLLRRGWNVSGHSVGQLRFIGDLVLALGSLPLSQLTALDNVPFPYRIDDHRPHHYVARLTPQGRVSEFGDRPYAFATPWTTRLRRQLEEDIRVVNELPLMARRRLAR